MNQRALSAQWIGDEHGHLRLLDQTLLPSRQVMLDCRDVETVWEAIKMLRVRGAPAIGIAAAYGVLLARAMVILRMWRSSNKSPPIAEPRTILQPAVPRQSISSGHWIACVACSIDRLPPSNPSSIRCGKKRFASMTKTDKCAARLVAMGADLIPQSATIITHCNAGGLATSEYGTALSVLFTCAEQGKKINVYADETRPLWQGSRLTAFELHAAGIPTTVICDSMAAHVMQTRKVDAVVVGADRITARGDTANKIGTYGLAVSAKYHGVPFYVAAPSSTFDLTLVNGQEIPIEQRDQGEITKPYGIPLAPEGVNAYNPAFDVTPAELITAIITERGVMSPVTEREVRSMIGSPLNYLTIQRVHRCILASLSHLGL